jgi:hypothetical protein
VPDNISWAFNAESHILSSLTYSSIRNRLRCLSLDIHDGNNVHSLDSFLPTLALYIHDDLPTPMVLAACWSILSGVWPSPTGRPTFHAIDRNGEEHTIPIFEDYDEEEWSTVLGIPIPAREEEEGEGEGEEGEEEEAEGGEAEGGEAEGEEEGGEREGEGAKEEEGGASPIDPLEGFVPLIQASD